MKSKCIGLACFFTVLFVSLGFAEGNLHDILYLKNGMQIKGKISETLSGDWVKVVTEGGGVLFLSSDEIQSVAEEKPLAEPISEAAPGTTGRKFNAMIHAGVSVPTGDVGNIFNTGYLIGFDKYFEINRHVAFTGALAFSHYTGSLRMVFTLDGKDFFSSSLNTSFSALWITFGPKLQTSISPEVSVNCIAQIGIDENFPEGGDPASNFGYIFGGGIVIQRIGVQFRYHSAVNEVTTSFLNFSIGYNF